MSEFKVGEKVWLAKQSSWNSQEFGSWMQYVVFGETSRSLVVRPIYSSAQKEADWSASIKEYEQYPSMYRGWVEKIPKKELASGKWKIGTQKDADDEAWVRRNRDEIAKLVSRASHDILRKIAAEINYSEKP